MTTDPHGLSDDEGEFQPGGFSKSRRRTETNDAIKVADGNFRLTTIDFT